MTGTARGSALLGAAGPGRGLGLGGVAVMTAGEKLEQAVTGRPNSYVPARTLLTLLGRRPAADAQPAVWNHLMHWGTGAAVGALRGVWSVVGLRGPNASLAHTVVRLATDQTLENITGAGAPPRTWPTGERVVDVAHKAVYAFVTGALTDRLIAPELERRAGTTSR
jgi:hypothetical protein